MKFNALLVSAAMMVMTLAACGDDDPVNPDNNQGGNEDTETVEGDVEGTWKANSIILVSGSIYGHAIIPIDQIIWIYKYSTLHKFFWYHFSISYTLHISANKHLYIWITV